MWIPSLTVGVRKWLITNPDREGGDVKNHVQIGVPRKYTRGRASRSSQGGERARVIYYWANRHDQILLLFAYAKNELADLNVSQAAELGKLVKKEFGNESGIV